MSFLTEKTQVNLYEEKTYVPRKLKSEVVRNELIQTDRGTLLSYKISTKDPLWNTRITT